MVLFVIWGEGGQLDRAKDMPTFHRRREHRSCTIYSVGREKVNCRAAAREAGLGHDSARRMCQFITGRKCRCARQAHYDSLRAAAKRRLLACTLAAAREEGRHEVSPLLRITPFPLGRSRYIGICPKICGICCRK